MSDIFCSIRRSGISCESRHLFESNWTLHSSVSCISKKIYATRTDEWKTACINPCVPFLGMDTEREYQPVVSSFHQTYKTDKIRFLYLSNWWALFTHKEPGGHYFARENYVDIICLTPHNSHKMLRLNKAFLGPLETFYCQETEK